MSTQKLRIIAKEQNCRRFAIVFMGVKVVVAVDRDSGAKVGYNARIISGDIGGSGSTKNWYCYVEAGSIFELEVDAEFYQKNKNRIKKWEMIELDEFTITKERSDDLKKMDDNIE